MKVHNGTRLTTKSNPYYIELSGAYSLLSDLSAKPSQADQTTNTKIQFKISAAITRHENKNNKINKYIFENKDNDAVIINAAITLAEDECNVMDKDNMTTAVQVTINEAQTYTHQSKPTIHQINNIGNAFSTAIPHRTYSMTRDGNHVQFRNSPTIATYHKYDNTTMLTYNSGADGHYPS